MSASVHAALGCVRVSCGIRHVTRSASTTLHISLAYSSTPPPRRTLQPRARRPTSMPHSRCPPSRQTHNPEVPRASPRILASPQCPEPLPIPTMSLAAGGTHSLHWRTGSMWPSCGNGRKLLSGEQSPQMQRPHLRQWWRRFKSQ